VFGFVKCHEKGECKILKTTETTAVIQVEEVLRGRWITSWGVYAV